MYIHSSPMEIMRQFLAAFAGANRNTLNQLLSDDAHLTIKKMNMWFQSRDSQQVVDFLLAETNNWARSRIDVQSWSGKDNHLTVKFHAHIKRNDRNQEYAYTVSLTIENGRIEVIKICGQNIATAKSVWQFPKRPNFRLAPR